MIRKSLLLVALLASFARAQQPPVNSPLLDHLVGAWTLEGTIAGEQVTHDISAEWMLDHHYLRIHEVSREMDKGKPKYEAVVVVAWNEQPKQYACAWFDVLGGLAAESIGIASPKEDDIPFVFKDEKGNVTITNDMRYLAASDTWEWRIDNVDKGVASPFARVKLSRTAH